MMKAYERYKPSGIDWLGDIPEHWKTKKLKFVSDVVLGKMLTNDDKGDYLLKPYLRAANLQWMNVDVSSIKEMWFSPTELEKLRIKESDLLVSEGGEVGRTCIWRNELNECYLQNSVHKISFFDAYNSKFFLYQFYFLGSIGFFESVVNRISIAHLTGEKIKETQIWFPPLPEQTAIAKYLDDKTAQLDKLIEGKRRLIELLKEERSGVINKAVTRGINPHAKLKPSGIDWLGDIPEHWEVKKLKFIARIKYGLGQPPNQQDDGLPLIRATNVERGKIVEKDLIHVDPEDIPYDRDPILKENDIIVVRSGAYTADSAIIPKKYEGAIAGYDMVVRAFNIYPAFLSYCLLSNYILVNQLFLQRLRAAQPHLNKEELGETFVLLPDEIEQKQIVQFIETETGKIDATVATIEKEIEYLREYRTALISEVVTGKIKVA